MRLCLSLIRTGTSGETDFKHILKTIKIDIRSSADPESHKVRKITSHDPVDAGEPLGKRRGFGWRDFGIRSHKLNYYVFIVI